jgi:polar amino acid transport system substrate-binding protein
MKTDRHAFVRLSFVLLAVAVLGVACKSKDKVTTKNGGSTTTTTLVSRNQTPQGAALKTVKQNVITVCSDIPYPPFEYEESGKVVGIDADVMRAIGGRLGLTVEFVNQGFDAIFAALAAGKCDVIASSVSINDERKKSMDFSDPYFDIVQSLLVRKADATKYKDLASLKGKTIGVQSGTTGQTYAKANASGSTLKEFTKEDEMISALKAGTVDALLQDLPVNQFYAKAGDLAVVKQFTDQKESYGIVIPKGKTDLKKAIDDSLKQIRSDDTYPSILRIYLGDTATSDSTTTSAY